MSKKQSIIAALEEFEQKVASELTTEAPAVDEVIASDEAVTDESSKIDEDVEALASSGDALESIIALVQDTPIAMNKPLDAFSMRAVKVALESNDVIASSGGGALVTTADKGETKKDFLDKAKDFAKKIWEALASMAGKVLEWIKATWAKVTDRLVKNTARAKKHLETISSVNSRPGAKIEDARILKAVANAKGEDVGDVILAVFEHAKRQAEKESFEVARQAGLLVEVVASGTSNNEQLVEQFVETLAKAGGTFAAEATAEQAQAIKAPAGCKVIVSEPFFGGKLAWLHVPENADALHLWNHGLSDVDKPKEINAAAPDVNELKAICEYIAQGQALVKGYQEATKPLDELSKKLKSAISKEKGEGDKKLVRAMQSVIPRIVKGPQVTAYNYAGTASSIALAYVDAALAAHQKDPNAKTVGERVGEVKDSVKEKFSSKK